MKIFIKIYEVVFLNFKLHQRFSFFPKMQINYLFNVVGFFFVCTVSTLVSSQTPIYFPTIQLSHQQTEYHTRGMAESTVAEQGRLSGAGLKLAGEAGILILSTL